MKFIKSNFWPWVPRIFVFILIFIILNWFEVIGLFWGFLGIVTVFLIYSYYVVGQNRSSDLGVSRNQKFQLTPIFEQLFDDAPFPIVQVSRDSELILGNGLIFDKIGKMENFVSTPNRIADWLAQKDQEKLLNAINETLSKRVPQSVDVEFISQSQNQSATIYALTSNQLAKANESVLLFIFETTQFRNLEVQFAQSQKMQAIGQLAGGIAHDFNNVLTAIIGAVDLLLANHRNTDPSFQDIMSIKNNANRASALVRQLLAFSRRQTLIPTEIDVNDRLSDLVHLLQSLLGEKISVQITSGKNLWPIMADATQFDQVLINLAVNARDAMPNGGKLTIRVENVPQKALNKFADVSNVKKGDYILLEVTDSGTGMSKELTEKIFEPFFTTKEVGEGTGLGLSTVYGIVDQSSGYIFPESQEGQGTSFKIFLPRYKPGKRVTSGESELENVAKIDLTGSATILLVEDDESVRFFAKRALSSRGYTVLEASSGAEALNIMNNTELDIALIVSDVVMPEMDGPTLLTEIRKTKPNIKVIFISGYAKDAFENKLAGDEEFIFLAKPFTLKELSATVKEVLG